MLRIADKTLQLNASDESLDPAAAWVIYQVENERGWSLAEFRSRPEAEEYLRRQARTIDFSP